MHASCRLSRRERLLSNRLRLRRPGPRRPGGPKPRAAGHARSPPPIRWLPRCRTHTPQGQARDLPLHAGRRQPRRFLRLQAAPRQGRRQACCRSTTPGLANTGTKASSRRVMKPLWKFAQHGQCGRWASDLFPEMQQARRRPLLPPLACTPKASPTARPRSSCTAARPISSGRRMGSWVLYGLGHRERESARVRLHRARRRATAARATTATPSCPPSTRARRSARPAARRRRGHDPQPHQLAPAADAAAPASTCSANSTPSSSSATPATRNWRR